MYQYHTPPLDFDQPERELRYYIERTEHDGSTDVSDYDFVYLSADQYTDPAFDIDMFCSDWLLAELVRLNPEFIDEVRRPAKKIEVVFQEVDRGAWDEVARIDIATLYASYLNHLEALALQEG